MKCEVCNEEHNKGNTYEFFTGFVGETVLESANIQVRHYKTPQYLHNKIEGWVCRRCYLKNLLFSEKTIVVVGIIAIFSVFNGKFINNFLIGLFFSGIALGLLWISNVPFFWTQHGDRALIKHYHDRDKLKRELQGLVDANPNYKSYKFYDRSDAHKVGWIKDSQVKI
ncbi:MAG: hypothetical protein C4583_02085 [Anaerolineaceae bacterium]|nr:MAG: hypothetical protein C4583_02085 [Anaerolineaceae bacterium]